MFQFARPVLFALEPERAHDLSLAALACAAPLAQTLYGSRIPDCPRTVMGLRFANPIGLAAGLDKDGTCIDGLGALGFGFLEIGTVTPRAQPGNPAPRVFRLVSQRALINRLGFNNEGVDQLVPRLAAARYAGIRGVNIGKNFDTPHARAVDDYRYCLRQVYVHADYVTVNISSPNTAGLRDLQGDEALASLLAALKSDQARLADAHGRYVPLAVKIAPDLDSAALDAIATALRRHAIDAVIATNTTLDRTAVAGHALAGEQGGLSGAPLAAAANRVIRHLADRLAGELPIIGVGGVFSGADARAKLEAGASLVQIYTGLIYRGPSLIAECVRASPTASTDRKKQTR